RFKITLPSAVMPGEPPLDAARAEPEAGLRHGTTGALARSGCCSALAPELLGGGAGSAGGAALAAVFVSPGASQAWPSNAAGAARRSATSTPDPARVRAT